jgi:hypothetical protein
MVLNLQSSIAGGSTGGKDGPSAGRRRRPSQAAPRQPTARRRFLENQKTISRKSTVPDVVAIAVLTTTATAT